MNIQDTGKLIGLAGWLVGSCCHAETGPETWKQMLSGQGPADAVEWDFQVSAGRRAGERAKIPVPSQWEQHGFGDYDYGSVPDAEKHKEDGLYQRDFTVPENWKGRRVRIVFDGSMTDTTVTVNGIPAGPVHQGAFYRFHHDITDKIRFGGTNKLEVLVSKDSANPSIEGAERGADFWVFGGIFRPVWLEARPEQSIEWAAIDAAADGRFRARVHLTGEDGDVTAKVTDRAGRLVGESMISGSAVDRMVELSGAFPGIRPWSAEEPNLYQVEFSLMRGDEVVHRIVERFGFRSIEARQGEGLFVNGRRVTIKGVNRHCFRPRSGRALDPQDSIDDVRLIKSMNMNSVRCSHYPPDKVFLDACDELGLYVESELCTWQKPVIDTENARRLIGQMIRRDVNHPSILWWANGNEGGWNTEVDGDYAIWDLQRRPVLHPWEEFSGFQTKHYPVWERLHKDLDDKHLVMPTEFLHGLYDGGHGAGLEDYWNAITSRRNGVGGFLWVLADEGIVRTDRGGEIDNWGTNAPDGIVGPHHEKEASYLTVKDIFCPVQIAMKSVPADFDGKIEVRNGYDFRDLSSVRFKWSFTGGGPVSSGTVEGPRAAPGESGALMVNPPDSWRKHTRLELAAEDAEGNGLWTWAWSLPGADESRRTAARPGHGGRIEKEDADGEWRYHTGGDRTYVFDPATGRLKQVLAGGKMLALANGPRLVAGDRNNVVPPDVAVEIVRAEQERGVQRIEAKSSGAFQSFAWTIYPDGLLDLEYVYQLDSSAVLHGITFDLPEKELRSFSWTGQGPERVWANRMRGTGFGSFEREWRKLRPGKDYGHPHAAGYYAGVHSASVRMRQGSMDVIFNRQPEFLRIGTNDEGEKITTYWPDGDFSVLHAIPAIGNKFDKPEVLGPQSQPHAAPGQVSGKVAFRFAP